MRIGTYYRYLVTRRLDLPLSGNRLLDIGCYDGFLLSHVDAKVKVGIDIEPVPTLPNIQYVQGDFLEHDFGQQRFDRVFALDVLEHVKDDTAFVEKVVYLLSVDGIAILSTPSKAISVFPPFAQAWVDRKWDHSHRRGYTRQQLGRLANGHNVRLLPWNCPLFRLFYLPLSVLWRICPSLGKLVLRAITVIDAHLSNGEKGFYYAILTSHAQVPRNL
jgi:SAM-dependent methyltransferase